MFKNDENNKETNFSEAVKNMLNVTDNASTLKIKHLLKTNNSKIYMVSTEALDKPIIVKKYINGDCKKQYESLLKISKKMPDANYRVPKPIAYDVNQNILTMEFVQGQSVLHLLTASNISSASKLACINNVANWLARFHAISNKTKGVIEVARRLEYIEKCLCKVNGHEKKETVVNTALNYLYSQTNELERLSVTLCTTHGDCKPENFIVNQGVITGIDLDIHQKGLPLMDVAQFLNHIMYLSVRPTTLVFSRYLDQWVQSFINTYRQEKNEYHEGLLKWLRIGHYLRYWAKEQEKGGLSGRLQASIIKKLITRELN